MVNNIREKYDSGSILAYPQILSSDNHEATVEVFYRSVRGMRLVSVERDDSGFLAGRRIYLYARMNKYSRAISPIIFDQNATYAPNSAVAINEIQSAIDADGRIKIVLTFVDWQFHRSPDQTGRFQ